ncbi:reverse transcriptase family protein [Burkholderia oklahomensis]|uniref:reverse transcriptase family protein n=1 Tax=Burkholderia oklahomensis TaxID=342113 RepID=UPI00130E676B|nr:reverse transcriptase family protein [Burkholderia oklahomensis]MBI0360666.1 RNA-directed DNA polymerase [Burkholderia oklahomensis]
MRIALICEDHGQKGACRTAAAPSDRPPFGRRLNESNLSFALPVNTPPLLVNFPSLDFLLKALAEETREIHADEIRFLIERQLPPAVSTRVIATLFGFSPLFLSAIARRPDRYYRQFEIRSGAKLRQIQSPKVALKLIQRWIGGNLATSLTYPDCVYGFVPGRSHIEAAAKHCGADWVYSADVKDFFQSTSFDAVQRALTEVGYQPKAAQLVATYSCFKGFLAQGAPSSPVLSNLVFLPYDRQLLEYAVQCDITYTRYADDVVLSGRGQPPEDLKAFIHQTIEAGGWVLSERKEKLSVKPHRLKVHGLLVDGDSPRLTKGYRHRIRALTHLLEKGSVSPETMSKVLGHINYAKLVAEKGRDEGQGGD